MDVIMLAAQPREAGKRGARAARRNGDVPCVLYGHHVAPVAFQVSEKSLKPLIYTDETHIVQVELDSDSWECIIKDIAFHPVTDRPMHADFQVLQAGEKVTMAVPVRYLGTPIGQTHGGRTNYVINELEITCLPKDIPSHVDIDVSEVDIGDAVYVSDLDFEALEFHAPTNQILMTILRPRVLEEPTLAEGLEEGAEGEEGAEAEEGEE